MCSYTYIYIYIQLFVYLLMYHLQRGPARPGGRPVWRSPERTTDCNKSCSQYYIYYDNINNNNNNSNNNNNNNHNHNHHRELIIYPEARFHGFIIIDNILTPVFRFLAGNTFYSDFYISCYSYSQFTVICYSVFLRLFYMFASESYEADYQDSTSRLWRSPASCRPRARSTRAAS